MSYKISTKRNFEIALKLVPLFIKIYKKFSIHNSIIYIHIHDMHEQFLKNFKISIN